MITSDKGREFIKSFEKCRLAAYDDGVGVMTIGYGHTKGVQRGDECTQAQADEWFDEEISEFETGVRSVIKPQVSQNEFDALCSLAFNIGLGAFSRSTLLRLLNARDFENVPAQFDVWNKGGGKVMQGLVKRRAAERMIFTDGVYVNHV